MSEHVHSTLLFLELGSVSFKASLIPKDEHNQIFLGRNYPEKKLRNLISLAVYREQPLGGEIAVKAREWFQRIRHDWAANSVPRPDEVLVVATAALRDTPLYDELAASVEATFGTTIHTVDGFAEAQLLVNGYRPSLRESHTTVLFDLGGGSLEIVCLEMGSTHFTSMQLGSGRVTAWLMDGIPRGEVTDRIQGEFEQKCQTIRTLSRQCHLWHGAGGAVKSFLKATDRPKHDPIRHDEIRREMDRFRKDLFDHRGCLRSDVIENDFEKLTRAAPEGLRQERRRIYVGGILILHAICKFFSVTSIKLDMASVRNGVLKLLELLRPTPLS